MAQEKARGIVAQSRFLGKWGAAFVLLTGRSMCPRLGFGARSQSLDSLGLSEEKQRKRGVCKHELKGAGITQMGVCFPKHLFHKT